MLSSWQIAAMHGQQAQMFSQQQQAVHPISAQMPSPYGGFAGPGGMDPFGGGAFGAGPGPGFNYGAGRNAPTAMGNAAVSAMAGVGQTFVNPMSVGISGAFSGFKMGGMRGAMMGGALGMGIGAIGSHVIGSMVEGAQEQNTLERTLSRMQFTNSRAFSGRGFSRQDSKQIGDMVRQMERIPEMLTSFGELNRIMDKSIQSGLMQGVRNVSDFKTKFESTVKTLQTMAKTMGTTMEGALQMFNESRLSGFYSKGDIVQNVMNTKVTTGLTGMTTEQAFQLQRHGSERSHAYGGSRAGGARHITRAAQQLGAMQQMGTLTDEQVVEITGKTGAAGLEELAAGMTEMAYRLGRTPIGQAMTLAAGKVVNGRFTGEVDQDVVDQIRSGGISRGEMMKLARRNSRGRGAQLSFAANRKRMTAETMGAVGLEGYTMELQHILGNRGWKDPDAQNLVMQKMGITEEYADLLQKMIPNLETAGLHMSQSVRQQGVASARQMALQPMSLDAVKHRISKRIEHVTTDWAKDLSVGIRDGFIELSEKVLDDASGVYRKEITQRSQNIMQRASHGNVQSQTYMKNVMQQYGSRPRKGGITYEAPGYWGPTAAMKDVGRWAGEDTRSMEQRLTDFERWNHGGKNVTDTYQNSLFYQLGEDLREGGGAVGEIVGGGIRDLLGTRMHKGSTMTDAQVQRSAQGTIQTIGMASITRSQMMADEQSRKDLLFLQKRAEEAAVDPRVRGETDQLKQMQMFRELTFGINAEDYRLGTYQQGEDRGYLGAKAAQKASDRLHKKFSSDAIHASIQSGSRVALPDMGAIAARFTGMSAYADDSALSKEVGEKEKAFKGDVTGGAELLSLIKDDSVVGRVTSGLLKSGADLTTLSAKELTPELQKQLYDLGITTAQEQRKFMEDPTRFDTANTLYGLKDKQRSALGDIVGKGDYVGFRDRLKSTKSTGKELQEVAAVGKTGSAAYLARTTKGSTEFLKSLTESGKAMEAFGDTGLSGGDLGKSREAVMSAQQNTYETYAKGTDDQRRGYDQYLKETGQEGVALKGKYTRRINRSTEKARKGGMRFSEFTGGDEKTLAHGDVGQQQAWKFMANPEEFVKEQAKSLKEGKGATVGDVKVDAKRADLLGAEVKRYTNADVGQAGTSKEGGVVDQAVQQYFASQTAINNAMVTAMSAIKDKIAKE